MENRRLEFVDHAKALAILLMVLLHATSRYPLFSEVIGAFHMAIFFLIGGLFFSPQKYTISQVVKKSTKQLLIP